MNNKTASILSETENGRRKKSGKRKNKLPANACPQLENIGKHIFDPVLGKAGTAACRYCGVRTAI